MNVFTSRSVLAQKLAGLNKKVGVSRNWPAIEIYMSAFATREMTLLHCSLSDKGAALRGTCVRSRPNPGFEADTAKQL